MFLDLANELLASVVGYLEAEKDINSLARTNHRLYRLSDPYLYHHNAKQAGNSALLWASLNGQERTAEKAIRAGSDLHNGSDVFDEALILAARHGNEKVVELCGKSDMDGRTPHSLTALKGHDAIVKILLDTGKVNADSRDKRGRTPLSLASSRGHDAIVKMLLATGQVNADSRDEDGWTPLSLAADKGHDAIVKMLLDTGQVDADSQDKHGRTPLSFASDHGHDAIAKLLLVCNNVDVELKIHTWANRSNTDS
jgi:ankyrin repeat protein